MRVAVETGAERREKHHRQDQQGGHPKAAALCGREDSADRQQEQGQPPRQVDAMGQRDRHHHETGADKGGNELTSLTDDAGEIRIEPREIRLRRQHAKTQHEHPAQAHGTCRRGHREIWLAPSADGLQCRQLPDMTQQAAPAQHELIPREQRPGEEQRNDIVIEPEYQNGADDPRGRQIRLKPEQNGGVEDADAAGQVCRQARGVGGDIDAEEDQPRHAGCLRQQRVEDRAIFYTLLPQAPGMTWLIFLGVYVASYTAGLAANLPGGIGVFDTAILFGLEPYLSAPRIVGAILIFRLYYYVIPLFLAGSLFAGNELVLRGGGLLRHVRQLPALQAIGRWSEPDFAVASATGAVGLCGVLMLCLGVLAPQADFSWLDPNFAGIVSQAGQFIPSLIGAGLVVMAIALSHRVNLAWGLTLFLLAIGTIFAAAQGGRLWVAALLILTMMLLAPFRACFYRHAHLLSGPLQPSSAMSLVVLVICLFALAVTRPHTHLLANNAWWAIILSEEVPNSLRAAVAVTVVLGLTAIWLLVRPGRVRFISLDANGRQQLQERGITPPPAAEGVVLGEADRAIFPFRRVGRVLLGLGDPTGAETDRVSAIWRLRDLAQQEGLDPAVWRAGPSMLKVYGDLGLTALPLGADGLPLPEALTDETPESEH